MRCCRPWLVSPDSGRLWLVYQDHGHGWSFRIAADRGFVTPDCDTPRLVRPDGNWDLVGQPDGGKSWLISLCSGRPWSLVHQIASGFSQSVRIVTDHCMTSPHGGGPGWSSVLWQAMIGQSCWLAVRGWLVRMTAGLVMIPSGQHCMPEGGWIPQRKILPAEEFSPAWAGRRELNFFSSLSSRVAERGQRRMEPELFTILVQHMEEEHGKFMLCILFSVQFSYQNSTFLFQRFVAKKANRIFSAYSRIFIPPLQLRKPNVLLFMFCMVSAQECLPWCHLTLTTVYVDSISNYLVYK